MSILPTPSIAFDTKLLIILRLSQRLRMVVSGITVVCDFTKYVVAIAVADKSTNIFTKVIFENFLLKYGTMKTFTTDHGAEGRYTVISAIFQNRQTDTKSLSPAESWYGGT